MLMCLSAGLVGVLAFLQRKSLVGETLSHATYPGMIVGMLAAVPWLHQESQGHLLNLSGMIGAAISSFIALKCIHLLQSRFKVPADAALCFILASFFGIGMALSSQVQFTHTTLYMKMQSYLYGQPATMTDFHIYLYGALSFVVILVLVLFYKEFQLLLFDRQYARTLGLNISLFDNLSLLLIVFAVIIGIRSVGVLMISSMLIAPAVAARQLTQRVSTLFCLSGTFALLSGFMGNYLSVEFPIWIGSSSLLLPTGPTIILFACFLSIFLLFFAPERGFCPRLLRAVLFRERCNRENVLKSIWRCGQEQKVVSFGSILHWLELSPLHLKFILWKLKRHGWVKDYSYREVTLTQDGSNMAAKIVRLHRLWELYLTEYIEMGRERVHYSAEEMEHILTPEIEAELTKLLKNPQEDPHNQPIPQNPTTPYDHIL
jgi:manganese/zinc/iron transport system permease protein